MTTSKSGRAGRPKGGKDSAPRKPRKDPLVKKMEEIAEVTGVLTAHHPHKANAKAMVSAGPKTCRPQTEEKVYAVMALKYQGFTTEQIAEKLDMGVEYVRKLHAYYPEATAKAKALLTKNILEEAHIHQYRTLGTLTELGSKAVKTLSDIMDDPKASHSVRLRAATNILNLMFTGSEFHDKGDDNKVNKSAANFYFENVVLNQQKSDNEEYIVFDSEAEVMDGDNSPSDSD